MIRTELYIRGELWAVFKRSKEEFPDSIAFTNEKAREIHFSDEEICLETVRHEVFHAFVSTLCLTSAELSQVQFEEIVAELVATQWIAMDDASKLIYEWLVNPDAGQV
jgi:hypothetical protein